MKFEVLLSGLKNPQPAVRLDVVRVLGMLDETRALDALRQHYQTETDPTVREAVAWAGKRLYQAQQAGYSTQEELFRHFNVDKEIENAPSAKEAEMLQKLQDSFDADLLRMQERSSRRQLGIGVAAGLITGGVAGVAAGLGAAAGAMMSGVSSNLEPRPQIGTKRAPAMAPTKADISVWVKRLREAPQESLREQAAVELAQLNNPVALPHLAAAFVSDPSPQVRQAAQKYGKVLYWNMLYWEMEQDGSLAQEMKRRIKEREQRQPSASPAADTIPLDTTANGWSSPPPTSASQDVNVADILRRAQKGRELRLRNKK